MLPRRQFITKNNWNRFNARFDRGKSETYESYNDRMIKHEFLGYKIFGLVAHTPEHIYISKDSQENLSLNIERLQRSQSLGQYLQGDSDIKMSKDPNDFSIAEKTFIAERLNKLDGIGVQCFIGMLVGDFDLFGISLDNIRVMDGKAYKIDPSDVKLPFKDNINDTGEAYSECLPSFLNYQKKNGSFLFHNEVGGFLYFDFFFSMLSDEQKEQGIRAMHSFLLPEARERLTEFAIRLGYDHQIIDVLQQNAKEIISMFDPEQKFKDQALPLNDIQQTVLVRDEQHFAKTSETIKTGRSQPVVSEKTYSEKQERLKILTDCQGDLYNLIKALRQKQEKISEDNAKQAKASKLATPLKNLEKLYSTMALLLSEEKVSREELQFIYKTFDKISKDLILEFKNDSTESGTVNKLVRNLSDKFKLLPKTLGAEMQYSTIHTTETTQKAFNHHYGGFFQEVANDSLPQRGTNNNAGKVINANKPDIDDDTTPSPTRT